MTTRGIRISAALYKTSLFLPSFFSRGSSVGGAEERRRNDIYMYAFMAS